jgi:hypothetical protein
MTAAVIYIDFIRKHPAQVVLTVLGLSGVVLIFLPFIEDYGGVDHVPRDAFLGGLDSFVWFTLISPCVVLPFFISAGYLRWLFTGRLSRWESGLGYALGLTVVGMLLLAVVQEWWELFAPSPRKFLLGLAAGVWFVIQNLRYGAPHTLTALVAMQLAYLPFALGWFAELHVSTLIAGHTPDMGIGAYLAVLAVLVYTAQVALSVRGQLRQWLRLLPLGVVWVAGLAMAFTSRV